MKKVLKRFIRFWRPGSFFAEDWSKSVDSFDPESINFPEEAYCFQFWEREDVVDREENYEGKPKDVGPVYYHPDSKVETLEEVKRNRKSENTLIKNMENNGWDKIIWSRWGNWPQPFDSKKHLVLKSAKKETG